jgi:protein-S-isoprenylcysteine O-methyltransferase Ste14
MAGLTDASARTVLELQTLTGWARWIVTLCTISVLTAVFVNFQLARGSRAVRVKRKSAVETGSMLAFLVLVYLLIRFRVGARVIPTIHAPVTVVGLILVVAGTVVNLLGRFSLGRNWGNQVIIYQDHTLVTGGVYGLVRHPLYAGLVWMFLGASLAFQNWAALAATVFLFLPAMWYRAKQEEKALITRFPDYAEYRNRTGMLFPVSMGPEVVQISKSAFVFCRVSVTALLWVALLWHNLWLVAVVFLLLALSVVLKVQRSPMIQLYQQTVLRLRPSANVVFLDVPAMRFAHGLGAILCLGVLGMSLANPRAGWYGLAVLCLLKTLAALGVCPAARFFVCLRKGGCCALTRAG